MSIRLYIRIPTVEVQPDYWQELEWALYRLNGERLSAGVGTLEQIDGLIQQNGLGEVELWLLVPAQAMMSCQATIPARQARYVQQALPYAVEENIAQDIESMHLAISRRSEKGRYQVICVPHALMEAWMSFAESTGYALRGIYPDALALPWGEEGWSICLEDDQALLRIGEAECLRMHKANLPQYLELKGQRLPAEDSPRPVRIFVPIDSQGADAVLVAQLEQIEAFKIHVESISISPFMLLCESLQRQTGLINLCQGPYAVKLDNRSNLRPWLPLIWIAAAWFVLQVGIDLGTGFYHQRKAEQYHQQARALYLSIFPGETRVADIRRSLEGKIRASQNKGGATNFLTLFADAGYQLMQQPNRQAISLRSLNYSRQRGELSIELQASSFDQLDRYKQALAAQGYSVDIGSAVNERNAVRSRMNIRGES